MTDTMFNLIEISGLVVLCCTIIVVAFLMSQGS
jgi:hypothetical protein